MNTLADGAKRGRPDTDSTNNIDGFAPVRSNYNFVGINPDVMASPLEIIDISKPVPDGISGSITMEWHAETKILVGGADNEINCKLGTEFVLPGSSLRGMTRAALEILSFAHLNFFNDATFGTRDFTDVTWSNKNGPSVLTWKDGANGKKVRDEFEEPQAGLLRFRKEKSGNDVFELLPCVRQDITIEKLAGFLGWSEKQWHNIPIHDRRAKIIEKLGPDGVIKAEKFNRTNDAIFVVSNVSSNDGNTHVSKLKESVFVIPVDDDWQEIDTRRAKAIIGSQPTQDTSYVSNAGAASTCISLRKYWESILFDTRRDQTLPEEKWHKDNGIPVFWKNRKTSKNEIQNGIPNPTTISFSFTKLMRYTYAKSVGDLAGQTRLRDDKLDLVEALFGHVPPNAPEIGNTSLKLRQKPLRGRVMFGFAHPAEGQDIKQCQKLGGLATPRASFYPFYLRPKNANARNPIDYDNPNAKLAGRKRYLPRGSTTKFEKISDAQDSTMNFLYNPDGSDVVFTSEIKVRNVSPVELGGLIWALTLGQGEGDDKNRRHMLGRAKAHGYGQVRPKLACHNLKGLISGDEINVADVMEKFENWVTNAAGGYEEMPKIKEFLTSVDKETGAALSQHLAPPEFGTGATPVLDAYVRIKKAASHKNAGGRNVNGRMVCKTAYGQAGNIAGINAKSPCFQYLPPLPTETEEP